jgi:outer membrane protein
MINSKKIAVLFVLFVSISTFAQAKKWTLQECVAYALKNNISIQSINLTVLDFPLLINKQPSSIR